MRLFSLEGNRQRLDGGAMFGNAPRVVWSRWCPPDEQGRIQLACRALLIEDGDRLILCETGIGAFFAPEMRSRYGVVEDDHVLLRSLAERGFAEDDITHVVLSHLHFDHAGGLLTPWAEGQAPRLCFPRATYLVGAQAWERALHPHVRDRASFIPELPGLLMESGRLELVREGEPSSLGPRFTFFVSDGHTPGLLLLTAQGPRDRVVFLGDLVPGVPWVHLPITMGYDRFPELLIDEKSQLLGDFAAKGGYLFYTHDSQWAMSRVELKAGKMTAVGSLQAIDGIEI